MDDNQANIDKALLIIERLNRDKLLLNKNNQSRSARLTNSTENKPPATLPKEFIIDVMGSKILLKMPKRDADVQFITAIRYVKWIREQFIWQTPHYGDNLDRIRKYFFGRIERFTEHTLHDVSVDSTTIIQVKKGSMAIGRDYHGRMRLIFGYHQGMMNEVKEIGLAKWNIKTKWWSIPDTDVNFERIKLAVEKHGLTCQVHQNDKVGIVKSRRMPTSPEDIRPCPPELILK